MLWIARFIGIHLLCFAAYTTGTAVNTPLPVPKKIVTTVQKRTVATPTPFHFTIDPIVTCDSPNAVIPFTRAGNLIMIQARADTIEGNFILDTGAPGLVLNMTYFRHYYSETTTDQQNGGITGGFSDGGRTLVKQFAFGPVRYSKVEADRINLGHIETSKGVKILGLLGTQLFSRFEMIIDYERSVILLHLIDKKEIKTYKSELLNDPTTYTTIPFDLKENKIIATGEMAGKKLKFLIDTGAESNVLDSRLPNTIFENVEITGRVLLGGSGDSKIEAFNGDAKDIKIGTQMISTLPVLITNLEKMCFSYDYCLDGMLGFDFLSLHKIGFNFVTRKMYIWK